MSIYKKLAEIQSQLKAPKNQFNKFGNFYYRSCEDILEGLKPILNAQKCALILNDEVVMIGERYYIKATALLIDTEVENSICSNTAYAREEESKKGMDGSQVTGASSSYARKYALNGLFALDDSKDSDATNTGGKDKTEANKQETKKISETQIKELEKIAKDKGTDTSKMFAYYKVKDFSEMTVTQYAQAKAYLNKAS